MDFAAGYLFVTFSGESPQGEQVYFSLSRDGFSWQDLNGGSPVLCSEIGERGVRDPFILRSQGRDKYYLIATDLRIASGISWEDALRHGSRSILVWESADLIHWSRERSCEIGPSNAGCVWAPEAVYDCDREAYMVFWSSYVEEKHRIYRSYTRDFHTFTDAEIYLEQDYDVIDMTIIRDGETFYRFYKDERNKNLCMDSADSLNGEFRKVSAPKLEEIKGVEGPAVFPLRNGRWCLLADQFAANEGYRPMICENLSEGEFCAVSKKDYDMGWVCKRHGSVLPVSEQEFRALEKSFGKGNHRKTVRITDRFWKKEIELIKDTMLPYQWEALNDRIPDAQPSYCMHNFKVAGRITGQAGQKADYEAPVYTVNGFCVWPDNPEEPGDRFYGFVFQDSDFAKWIEAVAYILRQYPDEELERRADEAIEIVCSAQQPDGYLDTFYIINDMSKRFTNLRNNHELYCLGHLIEGAVAYYQTTGKDRLLGAACRYADCVDRHIGSEAGKLHGYPGHEIAEMALARLYEVTGKERYKELGLYFINERGKRPYYYDLEEPADVKAKDEVRYQYQQAHQPVREQSEAVGHAVRAVYLYSGMADFARLMQDDSLKKACERLWEDIVSTKMYITGGIGGTHIGEAFSYAYDLPNDTAYAETCASVGMVFFARRMLGLEQNSNYADVMERELYNVVLAGMGLAGNSFFYVNPLEVVPEACHKDERKEHVEPVRKRWFGCACCPPNLARLIGSIGEYIFTETKDTLFVHLYVGCHMEMNRESGELQIDIQSGFPWDGYVNIQVKSNRSEALCLALRIPDWSRGFHIEGAEDTNIREQNGYLYLTKMWSADSLRIEFPMEVRVLEADYRVREDIGKAAVMRGPLVYCLEEADNGKDLHMLKMDREAEFETEEKMVSTERVTSIKACGWRQKKIQSKALYFPSVKTEFERTELTWIPYYVWANRGEGEMQVWTRAD